MPSDQTLPFKHAHFIGIGGAGMSGIALVLHERGCKVSGSDLKQSSYVRKLIAAGVAVHIGHEAQTIDIEQPDVCVVSSAIPETNPEVIRARELGIAIWPRAKMLSALSLGRSTVAIAGTHGKTTTSSMIASMFDALEADPSFLIGGIVEKYATNGRNGSGEIFVAEADESDGSFLYLNPDTIVVTNVEADHLDHYGTFDNLKATFTKFMNSVSDDGTLVVCADDPCAFALAQATGKKLLTYGFSGNSDYVCSLAQDTQGIETNFVITDPQGQAAEVTLKTNPGRHNVLNATAACVVAGLYGYSLQDACVAISSFEGVHRRFTQVGSIDGIHIVDDYGHHPTEIAATLKAAKTLDFKRVVVIFQPHRYSRTQALAHEFAQAFMDADKLFVTNVFSAGEMPIPGISGKTIVDEVLHAHPEQDVCYMPNRKQLFDTLRTVLNAGDLLITMGAGDITTFGPDFISYMQEQDQA